MNIMIVCTSPGLGGLELYARREWAFFASATRHNSYYVLSPEGKSRQSLDESANDSLIFIRPGKYFPYLSALRLARAIDTHEIDIVHMHWGDDLHLCTLAKRLSKRRPKLVYSRHMRITRPKRDLFHRACYRQVDLLLAVSRCVEEEAKRFLPLHPSQISLLHLGVATPAAAIGGCEGEIKNYARGTRLKIGMLGRIEHGKGQHILVSAIEMLRGRGLDVDAFIIGHAMDEAYMASLKQRVAERGLERHIIFIDFIKEPPRIMPCFDVITLLTYCETFGLVLAEAMRAGVCVIGTDAGGVPDIIEHDKTGLLIEPGNPEALCRALERLYHSEELRETLARQGQESANLRFDETTHFNRLETILTGLASH